MTRALSLLLLLAFPAAAGVPAWCPYVNKETPLYKQYCSPPVGLVCDGTPAQTVTITGFCDGWEVWRNADGVVIVCPGRQAPAGYRRLQ